MKKSDNPERENRILDSAVELLIHYGYDKTTISDIAREAGVSKGAIYLHFASKDALLEGLFAREAAKYQKRWLELLDADPNGGTIGGMYKNILYALNQTPFMAAIFSQDGRVLGSYLRKPNSIFARNHESMRHEFVKMMQEANAIRADVDAKVTAHIMDVLAYGLISIGEIKDEAQIPPLADVFEGIAEILDRALTPVDGGNRDAGKAIVRELSAAAAQRFEEEQE